MAMNKEIVYRPGDESVIGNGMKLVTLRLPADRYVFQRGQELSAICGDIAVPTVVFDTRTEPLNKIHPVIMALDGFFDVKTAVSEMRQIGERYARVKESTPFTWVAFLTNERINKLSPQVRSELVGEPMEVYLRNKQLAVELFGPAIIFWAQQRGKSQTFTNRFIEKNLKI